MKWFLIMITFSVWTNELDSIKTLGTFNDKNSCIEYQQLMKTSENPYRRYLCTTEPMKDVKL
jgi:hypothetical protein